MRFEWFPPDGDPIVFAEHPEDGEYGLDVPDGHSSTLASLTRRSAPAQTGETPTGRKVGARVVAVPALIFGATREQFQQNRSRLIAALASRTSEPGDDVDLGMLRVHPDGDEPLEIRAWPQDSPAHIDRFGALGELVMVEFLCPRGLWRTTTDTPVIMEPTDAGWHSPWDSPWESVAAGNQAQIDNPSHVPSPMLVRFHGEQSGARLIQVAGPDAGAEIAVTGTIDTGQFVEVDTGVERPNVTLEENGERTGALDRWDFDDAEFLLLPRGISTWRWEPTSAGDGAQAAIVWRPERAGW